VVGIRARTSHRTMGNFGSKLGVGSWDRVAESTGIDGASLANEGVNDPGVLGGVNAGDIKAGGGL
jgi:hypothetical protein